MTSLGLGAFLSPEGIGAPFPRQGDERGERGEAARQSGEMGAGIPARRGGEGARGVPARRGEGESGSSAGAGVLFSERPCQRRGTLAELGKEDA